ncbi:MAG: YciI family protein [Alphaproteobacteria bacterium]
MLFALLCYHDEKKVASWTKEEDEAVLAKRDRITDRLRGEGRLGPAARLDYTATAATVRMGEEPLVTDGPFAETKEQLLGFYVIEVGSLDEAVALAKEIGRGESVTFEVRPLRLFRPGADVSLQSKTGAA